MSSGITPSSECVEAFQNLKLGKKLKYIIYKLNDKNTEIIVEKTSNAQDYADFLADLPATEPRWAVYDFEYTKGDEGKRNKICFFAWTPEESKIKFKMVYSSSKESLRKALQGIGTEIQGTDQSEVAYETVLEKVQKF